MDVGMMMVFASYGWDDCSDARVWEEEIRLARLAADLGFDCLWSAEHHFNDYSFVPDNIQLMTYLTALCSAKAGFASASGAAWRGGSSPPSA
jgi:alkanesulfonate monooxygenase SsuD/methylene tetrahydromethanopterin reductase-like flavin-dependent oxidoreductase (luciferase family)